MRTPPKLISDYPSIRVTKNSLMLHHNIIFENWDLMVIQKELNFSSIIITLYHSVVPSNITYAFSSCLISSSNNNTLGYF